MTAQAFLALTSGKPTVTQPATTGGSGDANKIPALDSNGLIPTTMLPAGVGVDEIVVPTSENLSAGAFVNLYSNAGVLTARNADASTTGKEANGFVLTASTSPANNTVIMRGNNTGVSGLTIATQYWLSTTTPGGVQSTTSFSAGQTCQLIGKATSATAIDFDYSGFINT